MESFRSNNLGEYIRKLRKDNGRPLREVATEVNIDQAILSKVERGLRKFTRDQVITLAKLFKIDEKKLLILWLSDKIVGELNEESIALEVLKAAEEKVKYLTFLKTDRIKTRELIRNVLKLTPEIEKAWIYGSFSRNEDRPDSDIDIAVKAPVNFTYFDLARVKHELEKITERKIDIGFVDAFKQYIWEIVKSDLKLIYEKK